MSAHVESPNGWHFWHIFDETPRENAGVAIREALAHSTHGRIVAMPYEVWSAMYRAAVADSTPPTPLPVRTDADVVDAVASLIYEETVGLSARLAGAAAPAWADLDEGSRAWLRAVTRDAMSLYERAQNDLLTYEQEATMTNEPKDTRSEEAATPADAVSITDFRRQRMAADSPGHMLLLKRLVSRYLMEAGGRFPIAAADLADAIHDDDGLRYTAAAAIVLFLAEPGFSVHDEVFQADTGKSIVEFVQKVVDKMTEQVGAG